LSISKQIVELHGGSISASSDGANRGATFTVTLPRPRGGAGLDAARDGADAQPARAVALSGMRILVVDDEADARDLLHRILDEQGCRVDVARSAEEAWTLLTSGTYDVLLSDIGMPDTDGYELLRRVRAAPFAQPRAIAVTAFARPQDRERALAAGFDGHVAKPVDPARLLAALAQLGLER
jgi:CheY-like chemotaxis protein